MSLRCKVGMQVLQIKSGAGNEGSIGEVIELLGNDPVYLGAQWCKGYGACWLVQFPRIHKIYGGPCPPVTACPVPDAWLMPMDGMPMDENIDDEIAA